MAASVKPRCGGRCPDEGPVRAGRYGAPARDATVRNGLGARWAPPVWACGALQRRMAASSPFYRTAHPQHSHEARRAALSHPINIDDAPCGSAEDLS